MEGFNSSHIIIIFNKLFCLLLKATNHANCQSNTTSLPGVILSPYFDPCILFVFIIFYPLSVHNLKINYKMTKSRPHQLYKIDTAFQTTSTPPGAFLSPHACWPQPPSPAPSSDPSSGIPCQSVCFKVAIPTPSILVLFFPHCTTMSPILFLIHMQT